MTQKEINKFLANTKVYVNGKSEEIQKKLFSFGFYRGISVEVSHTEKPFLYLSEHKGITYGNDMKCFTEHKYSEISAEQILALRVTKPTYRPFKNQEECWQEMLKHKPFGWVKRIDTKYFANIAIVSNYGIMFRDSKEHLYDITLKEYTFADDIPFGIKEGIEEIIRNPENYKC